MLRRAIVVGLLLGATTIGIAYADGVRVGSEAEVTSDDGLNLRAKPDYSARVLGLVKGGHRVFVFDGPEAGADGPWYKVEYDGDVGWVLGAYLGPARARELSARGSAAGRGDETGRSTATRAGANLPVKAGSEAQIDTGDGVNLRAAPATDAKIVTIVNQTKYVYIIDGPELSDDGRPWFKVDYDGDIGWMIGSYLSPAKPRRPPAQRPVAAPVRAPSAAVATAPPIVIPANSGVGGSIAQNALKLIGSRYAFGGSSPASGFDCSGFVAYVLGAFGINPGRSSDDQAGAGYHVAPNQLLPGDIVVFANTYAGGYSHTGIYLGGGKFIHAEDWDTGVVVSSVFGGYWGRHYAGARRPW